MPKKSGGNLSLDGTIILGAMSSFAVAYKTGSTTAGTVAALLEIICLIWNAPQVVVGFVLTRLFILGGFLAGTAGAMFSLGIKPGWGRPQGVEGIDRIVFALVIFGG